MALASISTTLLCRRHYFNNTDALIFVVDSQDRDRLPRAGQEFRSIINDPLMKNSAILVFANKQVSRLLSSAASAVHTSSLPVMRVYLT